MECNVSTRAGAFTLNIQLTAPQEVSWCGVFGQSGAGKSTFLQALAGFEPQANISGQWGDCRFAAPQNAVLVSAQTPLFPALNVARNLELVARHNQLAAQIDDVVALCECEALLNRQPSALSGGELQRVKLARALLANPALLLLDESFSAMDKGLRQRILARLKRYLGARVKVMLVSHDMDDIALTCDWLGVISEGGCIACGPVNQLLAGHQSLAAVRHILPLCSVIQGSVVHSEQGITQVRIDESVVSVADQQVRVAGEDVRVLINARDVVLAHAHQALLQTNYLPARIVDISAYSTTQKIVKLDCNGQLLLALIDDIPNTAAMALRPDDVINAYFHARQYIG